MLFPGWRRRGGRIEDWWKGWVWMEGGLPPECFLAARDCARSSVIGEILRSEWMGERFTVPCVLAFW
jgi:hypothetical protein